MMNKKAVAAFAAGATLLAGFAMATPAMADADTDAKIADLKTSIALLETKMKNNNLKPSEEVLNKYDQAKTKFEETDKALTAAYGAYDAGFKAYKAKEVNKDKTTDDFDKDDTDKAYGTEKNQSGKGLSEALEAAKTAYNEAKTAFDEAKGKVAAYNSGYTQDVANLKALKEELAKLVGGKTTTSQPTKPGEAKHVHVKAADKAKAVEAVKTAKLHLDDAFAAYTKDYAEYEKAKATLAGKVAAQEAAEKALKAAQDALEAYNVSAKNDSALAQRLADAVDRAQAKVVFAVAETAKANKDYAEAKAKAVASTAKYNAALAEYKACYNDAVTFGVEASKLPPVVTSDPLAPNFEDVPGATKAMNDAASGKLGKAAQQAAAKKADAKGELAAKGAKGHGKSGEKLGNAGVGVALTALAASMLAGMGAAVRKMRH
ncbi:hypothetical protein [Gardnerella vaginalis]|uniref:hypothetical protein n=1 Tax=Gardnerella vaginalis TaxID=2702 RepID=UPI00200F28DC|nr:hypothetical protein [Gardnerella vaginalis]UQA89508.1 hypothetical protein K9E36_05070 [Gardnerella vaginalis]